MSRPNKAWRESLLAGRFAVVGVAATLVHMLVVVGLIEFGRVAPLLANLCAFLVAFSVSFVGHYRWTFNSPGRPGRALKRLFLISSSAFLVNTVLLAALLDAALLSPVVAAVLAAFIVPMITFLASRLWGFERAN